MGACAGAWVGRACLLAGVLLLAACSAARPPAAVESATASADHWIQRGLEQPGLQRWLRARGASHAPGQAWSERQLRLAALYFHPDEELARAGVQLAQADLRIAGQWPNPRLQLALKYQATQAVALPSPW
ncbi:MAG: TolC family protein, partial [Betaproteobacteria bacterium]|nr:TolC family protein [Betaproteobacteria bacterium]